MQSSVVIHASSSIDKATILVTLQNFGELISHKIQEKYDIDAYARIREQHS